VIDRQLGPLRGPAPVDLLLTRKNLRHLRNLRINSSA